MAGILSNRKVLKAIECSFAGIIPVFELEKDDLAVDTLYALTSSEESWIPVYLKVIKSYITTDLTGGCRYDVVLINTFGDDILINEEMVNRGLAKWKENMKEEILWFKKNFKKQVRDTCLDEETLPFDAGGKKYYYNEQALVPSSNAVSENPEFNWEEFDVEGNFLADTFSKMYPDIFKKNDFEATSSNGDHHNPAVEIKEIADSDTEEKLEKNIITNLPLEDEEYNEYSCRIKRIVLHLPTVYWRQSSTYVWLKILLPDVKIFKLYWTDSYINFQTMINEKIYWVDIDLFGVINPDTVMHKITGLYFEIRLTKVLTGFLWPRIFYNVNTKIRGIIHDPDKVVVEDDDWEDESLIPSYVARSEATIQETRVKSKVDKRFYKKLSHHTLEDGSGSGTSDESDIDDFNPIPDSNEIGYED